VESVTFVATLDTGHCANHPSREALVRCRTCDTWLCERCAGRTRWGVFCSGRCRARHWIRSVGAGLLRVLTEPLDPQWTITVTAALGALLLGGVGILVGELLEVSGHHPRHPQHAESTPRATARLVTDGDGWAVQVEGPADSRVLLREASGHVHEVTLDGTGRARRPAGSGGSTVWTFNADLPPAPTATAAPHPAVAPSPTPTPPTATPTPARPSFEDGRAVSTSAAPTALATRPTAKAVARVRPAVTAAGPSPPVLHLVPDAGPRIAITFDGGASGNRTAELLDVLQALDVEATLFLTGAFVRAHPALVRRAVLEGHEVGNHTDSHPHLTSYASDGRHRTLPGITREHLVRELRSTETHFRRATGRPMAPLWRAPYGEENPTLRRWAFAAGYLHVRWSSLGGRSLDTMDWVEDEHSPYFRDSRSIMDRLLSFPQLAGGITLMHLATDREEPPWTHLPEFVAALRARSIEPVRVTTLLAGSPTWRGWLAGAARNHSAAGPDEPRTAR
jgi:peptidoglycan/xylan/chitin deacetylase (PgdA/CDA1 family)